MTFGATASSRTRRAVATACLAFALGLVSSCANPGPAVDQEVNESDSTADVDGGGVEATDAGRGSATDAARSIRPPLAGDDDASTDVSPDIVEFRIPAGLGRSNWNSADDPVLVRVGQTLRIFNDDDTAPHAMHTFGVPCPHGRRIPAGEYRDCHIRVPFETLVNGILYDHYREGGEGELFFVRTIPAPPPQP